MDRIIVYSRTPEDHRIRLKQVLHKLDSWNLVINLERSSFATSEAFLMGFHLKNGTIKIHPKQTEALRKCPESQSMAMLKSFLGLSNFFRNYTELVAPLTQLTKS